jgi:hypothetical protein
VISGEAKFSIEWDMTTDEVTYKYLHFAKPMSLVTQMGYPVARYESHFSRYFAAFKEKEKKPDACLLLFLDSKRY